MERNLPIIAKRVWSSLQLIYVMLRKGVSKRNVLAHLGVLMKRGRLAGKAALQGLLFHYHQNRRAHHRGDSNPRIPFEFPASQEYDWRDSPVAIFRLDQGGKIDPKLMADALEIFHSARASPVLPGFGASPAVRQLRISDSPFPLYNEEEDDGGSQVDEAAEKFIIRFYRELELQNQRSPSFFK